MYTYTLVCHCVCIKNVQLLFLMNIYACWNWCEVKQSYYLVLIMNVVIVPSQHENC